MKINILISTIDSGISKIENMLLPFRKDINYIVSHQYTDEKFKIFPLALKRDDVLVSHIFGKGLMISRNHAINLASGDVCVIADDDVKYSNEYLNTIIDVYKNSEVDVACFKIFTGNSQTEYKKYPKDTLLLNNLKTYSPSSIEITFKLKPVLQNRIFFDERFGLGSWLNGGGENLFVYDSIKNKLKVVFFPLYVVEHPYESTIKSFPKYAQRRLRVIGALDARIYGLFAIPKAFASVILNFFDSSFIRNNYFLKLLLFFYFKIVIQISYLRKKYFLI
jgi:hypothetical protein